MKHVLAALALLVSYNAFAATAFLLSFSVGTGPNGGAVYICKYQDASDNQYTMMQAQSAGYCPQSVEVP